MVALTSATAIDLSLAAHGNALHAAEVSTPSPSQPASFEITSFRVEGASRLTGEEIATLLRPHVGPDRTFDDVRAAAKTLEAAYAAKGFSVVQVRIPPQEIADGVVTLRVIEARVARVVIEGNMHFDDRNVRASLPALAEGEAPNVEALGRSLRLANENPAKQTTVTLRPTETDGEVDAAVRIVDRSPHRFGISLDNTGTPETGDYRIGLGYQHANLFDRDHVLNVQ